MMGFNPSDIRIVVHGSFRQHFDQILETIEVFESAGFTVLAPEAREIISMTDGFAVLDGERDMDPRHIEARYLQHLKRLGGLGFSYFVDPRGYIGRTTSFELGIAQLIGVRCFFLEHPADHPAFYSHESVMGPHALRDYIFEHESLPAPNIQPNERFIHALWQRLVVPGSVVAGGAIIHHGPSDEYLFVKTHKWGGRYSIVGEKVQRGERLDEAILRGIKEETGLQAKLGRHIVTFDQIKQSGFHKAGVNHIFADYIVEVNSQRVVLDDEAEDYVWARREDALSSLDLEPNAKHTLLLAE
ncbi:NUDIX domain-containing protein [bacterium]|nr:NUDIX domain-containing protein [bacterium]